MLKHQRADTCTTLFHMRLQSHSMHLQGGVSASSSMRGETRTTLFHMRLQSHSVHLQGGVSACSSMRERDVPSHHTETLGFNQDVVLLMLVHPAHIPKSYHQSESSQDTDKIKDSQLLGFAVWLRRST